jgi:hypothetical protein
MGTGIVAAIPVIIAPYNRGRNKNIQLEYFSPRFADYYNYDADGDTYTIKHEVLLENYQSFLTEFYDCINESYTIEKSQKIDSYEKFKEFFDKNTRNMKALFLYDQWSTFSIVGGICPEYWLFYSGSYKAFLEEYRTLTHFERILTKAMKNPLVHTVKFGVFG